MTPRTAKNVFKLWVKKNLLSKKDLKVLEERINSFDVGTGIGRLPHRIASNYGGLHSIKMEELDTDLFHVLFERSFIRKPFEVLADICSCLPISLYSSSAQD